MEMEALEVSIGGGRRRRKKELEEREERDNGHFCI
jgi:hypothetical protein